MKSNNIKLIITFTCILILVPFLLMINSCKKESEDIESESTIIGMWYTVEKEGTSFLTDSTGMPIHDSLGYLIPDPPGTSPVVTYASSNNGPNNIDFHANGTINDSIPGFDIQGNYIGMTIINWSQENSRLFIGPYQHITGEIFEEEWLIHKLTNQVLHLEVIYPQYGKDDWHYYRHLKR